MLGQRLHNFEIVRLLGEGGMGAVYEAEHRLIRRKVAVKVLKRELALDSDLVQRFFNEARATSAIRHPNIVEVVDVGLLADGVPYLVMERLEGETLGDRLDRLGRLEVAQAVDFARQAASALEAAHDKGIIHRDLKPDNLFLVPDQRFSERELVKVLDFGIAKLRADVGVAPVDTVAGAVFGTPPYMSPEQCRGLPDELDQRTDVYALGIILYETLCGTPPFVGEGIGDVMMLHMGTEPTPPSVLRPELPAHIEQVILKALAKRREDRFPSMAEFRAALGPTAAPIVALPQSTHASARAGSATATAATAPIAVATGRAAGASAPGLAAEPGAVGRGHGESADAASAESTGAATGSRRRAERAPGAIDSPSERAAASSLTMPLAPARAAHRADSDAPTGQHAAPNARSRSTRWAVAGFGLLAAISATLFARLYQTQLDTTEPAHAVMPARTPPPPLAPATTATDVMAPPPERAVAAAAPAAAPQPAAAREPDRPRGSERQRATTSAHARPSARARTPAGESAQPSTDAAEERSRAEGPSASTAASSLAPAPTSAAAPGYLSLDSAPWSDVFLGPKLLGTTPLIQVPLPPGRHVLTLKNSELGKSTSYAVEIRSGKTVSRLVGWEK